MPRIKDLTTKQKDNVKRLEEENERLAHDRYIAEINYQKEKERNSILEQEMQEWKKLTFHLTSQLMKKNAELFMKECEITKLMNNDGAPMPF